MITVFEDKEKFYQWVSHERLDFEKENETVRKVIQEVYQDGDTAVRKYTKQFDGIEIENFRVSDEERKKLLSQVEPKVFDILEQAKKNITEFHQAQKQHSWHYENEGRFLGQLVRPIEKVGLYVPGGKGNYPSTVLMTAIPAKVAGVPEIYMTTPPKKDGSLSPVNIAAAEVCGIKDVFKIGGVQAVAAFAYGTKQIPKVYKVVGPGNSFVTLAKKYLYGTIDIDSLAGPSEVMILADETSNLQYIVADALAQAEHSEDAASMILLPNKKLADAFIVELEKMLALSPRKEILLDSIQKHSSVILYKNMEEAVEIMNEYAPEHLEIMSAKISYQEIAQKVKNAGAIFIGDYAPVALGDYFAGPNHTLPTSGTAKYASPLGVYDFVKYTSIIQYSRERFEKEKESIAALAELESFYEHANSIKIRK